MARPQVYSDKEIIATLRKTRGMVYLAEETLGCPPSTIYHRAKKSKAVAAAITHQRGIMTDAAESKLFQAIMAGESWAICFYLKTQGKDRGYIEKTIQEHQGKGGGAINLNVVYKDKQRD